MDIVLDIVLFIFVLIIAGVIGFIAGSLTRFIIDCIRYSIGK